MSAARLTRDGHDAYAVPMRGGMHCGRSGARGTLALLAGSIAMAGCVSIEAPSEPIVIELNINIRQEVIYRLAADAGNTIEENADIF